MSVCILSSVHLRLPPHLQLTPAHQKHSLQSLKCNYNHQRESLQSVFSVRIILHFTGVLRNFPISSLRLSRYLLGEPPEHVTIFTFIKGNILGVQFQQGVNNMAMAQSKNPGCAIRDYHSCECWAHKPVTQFQVFPTIARAKLITRKCGRKVKLTISPHKADLKILVYQNRMYQGPTSVSSKVSLLVFV